MRLKKPAVLKRGDVIGICAPASAPASPDALTAGIRYIERLGFRVELSSHLYKKRGYLAGSDEERTADLHELFRNRHVKAIFAARGGYGTHRLLKGIDYRLIRRNPKIVAGYSDITALQIAIFARAGIPSLSGPVVTEMPDTFSRNSEEIFWASLMSAKPLGRLRPQGEGFGNKGKTQRGILLGGNLSLVAGLIGTPYFPRREDLVLLLEEIDERPYRIDRSLQQIKLSGALHRARGIVLGSFAGCTPVKGRPSLRLREVFDESFQEFTYPIVSGFRYGHLKRGLALPLGVRIQVDGKNNSISFLESPVRA